MIPVTSTVMLMVIGFKTNSGARAFRELSRAHLISGIVFLRQEDSAQFTLSKMIRYTSKLSTYLLDER